MKIAFRSQETEKSPTGSCLTTGDEMFFSFAEILGE